MQVLMEISSIKADGKQRVLRIAAVRLESEKMVIRKRYSSFVRPECLTNINWQADEFLRGMKPNIIDGKPVDQALAELYRWLPKEDTVFCWDDMTRGVFLKFCRKNGLPEREIGTLREGVLAHLNDNHRKKGNPIKLCSVRGFDISGSCYDAEKVLNAEILLVRKIGLDFVRLSEPEPVPVKSSGEARKVYELQAYPLVYSTSSHRKTVHRRGCRWLRNISCENKAFFPDVRTARLAGYHPCYFCSPVRKLYSAEEERLINYSRPHGISVKYFDDALHIQSQFDVWRVVFDDARQKLVLLHMNTNPLEKRKGATLIPGFHEQKCDAVTLKGILRAVAKHDDYREQQNSNAASQKLKPKEAKKKKRKERKRGIRRTLQLLDALKASGQL